MDPQIWKDRILSADRFHNEWENLFKCKKLENYYEGFQWNYQSDQYMPYVLNMVYSTIKIKLANILYQNPEFQIEPFPDKMDWDIEMAAQTAMIKQDTLNTIIRNPNSLFKHNAKLAALDSFPRFGIIETGYATDWQNPGTILPLDVNEEDVKSRNEEVEDQIPVNERIYFKHVKASHFRTSVDDATILPNTSWCGYYTFVNRYILENTPGIEFPKDYKPAYVASDFPSLASYFGVSSGSSEFYHLLGRGEVCKIWKIWDNYENQKHILLDGNFDPLWNAEFERLPFSELRWDLRAPSKENVGWYPVPLIFQWLSPQDEINRTREQMRRYRRRFTRKFGYVKGTVEQEDLEKFSSDIDGEIIELKQPNAIFPLQNPEIGVTIQTELAVSLSDLNTVTGTTPPARGQTDRQTATATRIADVREQIRESVEQLDFSDFLCAVGREAILSFGENFAEGMWVRYTVDPSENFLGEVQAKAPAFKYVTSQEINDGYDMNVSISIINSTPARMMEEETKFLKFLNIVNTYPQISLSPIMIREAAYKVGYRNEKIIKEMQQTALLNMMGSIQQMGGGAEGAAGQNGINANNMARESLNAAPNPADEIRNQLAAQLGG